jgi:hypothetical protein
MTSLVVLFICLLIPGSGGAAEPRSGPPAGDRIEAVVVALRSAAADQEPVELQLELLVEGERVARSGPVPTPTGQGELRSIELVPVVPIPMAACRDLEIDVRVPTGARWSFQLVGGELATDAGAVVDVFPPSGPIELRPGRRSRSFEVRPSICP